MADAMIHAPSGVMVWRDRISREFVRLHPKDVFLFGDNLERRGLGGQAAEMRGEPNAVGIPTKRSPAMTPDAFFSDDMPDYAEVVRKIDACLRHASGLAVLLGGRIIVPAGLGQGLAELPRRAPRLWLWLAGELGVG